MSAPQSAATPGGNSPGARWSPFRVVMAQLRAARTPRVAPLPEWDPSGYVVSVRRSLVPCASCGAEPGMMAHPSRDGRHVCVSCLAGLTGPRLTPRVTPHPPGFCHGGCASTR